MNRSTLEQIYRFKSYVENTSGKISFSSKVMYLFIFTYCAFFGVYYALHGKYDFLGFISMIFATGFYSMIVEKFWVDAEAKNKIYKQFHDIAETYAKRIDKEGIK